MEVDGRAEVSTVGGGDDAEAGKSAAEFAAEEAGPHAGTPAAGACLLVKSIGLSSLFLHY